MKGEKDGIVTTAKKRYEHARSYYSKSRLNSLDDYRFVMGDSDNLYQWPLEYRTGDYSDKVVLTVNITAQHCNQVINNIRMNRPQGKVIPVDSGADKETARLMEGWIRSIQSQTNADECADNAAEWCIHTGEGYSWIVTEYESDDSFNQVIREYPIRDSSYVYIDPNAKQLDKSDAEWGMVLESVPKTELDKYDVDPSSWEINDVWVDQDNVIVCNYYYCDYKADTLEQYADGTTGYKSDNTGQQAIESRKVQRKQWWWCKLVGGEDKPISKDRWLGDWLPIMSVIGTEYRIDGEYYCKGMVRDLKDTGRMVNYAYSSAVEAISLQPKAPYIASVEATQGFERIWDNANTANYSRLPYHDYDANGNPVNKPTRVEPTQTPVAQLQLLEVSTMQAKAASGQQNANFGIRSNETSGVAIQRQKAQGELATFHYPDNLSRALRYRMKIYIDLAPKVYNERQVLRILGMDGSEEMAQLTPGLGQAYKESSNPDIKHLFDPTVGRYDVDIDTGASYQTQRQEGAAMLSEMVNRNPGLMQTHGDLVFNSMDWPLASDMAERSKKMLPPELKDAEEGQADIPPEVQQHLQQVDQQMAEMDDMLKHAQSEIDQMNRELQQKELELQQKDQAIMQEQAKRLSSEIQAKQANSLLTITKAEQSMSTKMQPKEMPEGEEPYDEEEEPDYKDPMLDQILWKLEESADKQLELSEMLAQGQAAMIEALNKPKQSAIKIEKQPDGSYVGVKEEN